MTEDGAAGVHNAPVAIGAPPGSKAGILEAAHEIIFSKGYAGLTMRELAESCGLAKATIYHHFRDKDDVYLQVMLRDLAAVGGQLREAAALPLPPADRLRLMVAAYLQLTTQNRHAILNALREIGFLHEALRGRVVARFTEALYPIGAVIDEGIRTGAFRPVNVQWAALSLVGIMNAFVTYTLFVDDAPLGSDAVEHTIDVFVRGLATGGAA
jgi:AcrR family transcriptional regulator